MVVVRWLYTLTYATPMKMHLEICILQSFLLNKYGSILLDAVKIIVAGYCTKRGKYGVCRGYVEEAGK